jgi:hypothetical protein
MSDTIFGYVGEPDPAPTRLCAGEARAHLLTDWHGNIIGRIWLGRGWRIPNGWTASRMYHAHAIVNGREYHGRTMGKGMSFKGKALSPRSRLPRVPGIQRV